MGLFGPPNFEKIIANRDIKSLLKALSDKDWKVRKDAALASEKLKDYFGIPTARQNIIAYSWPGKLDGSISKTYLSFTLNLNEEIVGIPLPVQLQVEPVFTLGPKRRDLLAAMCEKYEPWKGYNHPDWNFLALILTTQRVVVVAYRWAFMVKDCWFAPIDQLKEITVFKESKKLIELNFDSDKLILNPLDSLHINFTTLTKEDLPEWLKQANIYLKMVQKKTPNWNNICRLIERRRGGF
jgi:hypothetical protein